MAICVVCNQECDPVLMKDDICWDCQILDTGNKTDAKPESKEFFDEQKQEH